MNPQITYDLYRKSTRVTDPRGGVREYFYDDNGRMTQLTESDVGYCCSRTREMRSAARSTMPRPPFDQSMRLPVAECPTTELTFSSN